MKKAAWILEGLSGTLILFLIMLSGLLASCNDESISIDWEEDGDSESIDGDEALDGDRSADGDGRPSDGDQTIDGDQAADGDEIDNEDEPAFPYPIDEIGEVTWFPCSLYEGENDGRAECSSTPMPLFWGDDEEGRKAGGKTLTVYAKRLRSRWGTGSQLWLLHGGPGASGVHDFPYYMEMLQGYYPELDLYTIDHRGVGYSERLGCPAQEKEDSPGGYYIDTEELDDCIAYLKSKHGDDLDAFSTSYSAIDVAAYIHATREDRRNVIVWGGSYGTYIGQRYMQIFPDQADGVILEGSLPPDWTFLNIQKGRDQAGRALFDVCADDDFCSSKMGDDPASVLAGLLEKLGEGHCPQLGLDRDTLRYYLGYLLYYTPYNIYMPAVVYRLDRCEQGDVDAFLTLWQTVFGGTGDMFQFDKSFSSVLNMHISTSELFSHPDWTDDQEMLDYAQAIDDEALFGYNSAEDSLDRYNKWPIYYDPKYDNKWAEFDKPLLMLQGCLDPATPYLFAMPLADHFDGERQVFAAFPYATHNVTDGSPTLSDPYGMGCAMKLYINFLRDPRGRLNTDCMNDLMPIEFRGDVYYNEYILGNRDMWENGSAAAFKADPILRARVRRQVDRSTARLRQSLRGDPVFSEMLKRRL